MKKIALLGSTGSIGVNTLKIIENLPEMFQVSYLTAHRNLTLLAEQAAIFKPKAVVIADKNLYQPAKSVIPAGIEILAGEEAISEISAADSDIVVNALVGCAGLKPTAAAAKKGKLIALANKESLVMAGSIINQICKETGSVLHPIDSEHSAIFQSLNGEDHKDIKKIILTASGGPFRNRNIDFSTISVAEALNHPNWSMGQKITIDSATMMNKGFEMIEAVHLFNITPSQVEIVIHPESVIHSMVEYCDRSVIAQLGIPDMRIPIQYALTYPQRFPLDLPSLDFFHLGRMNFSKPDIEKFPAIRLAYQAIETGGTQPVVLNAVNEIMVYRFLAGLCKFTDIAETVENEMKNHQLIKNPTLNDIFAVNDEIWQRLN